MNFQLFEGAQDDVTSLTAVRCMLLPHNPYRLPLQIIFWLCGRKQSHCLLDWS